MRKALTRHGTTYELDISLLKLSSIDIPSRGKLTLTKNLTLISITQSIAIILISPTFIGIIYCFCIIERLPRNKHSNSNTKPKPLVTFISFLLALSSSQSSWLPWYFWWNWPHLLLNPWCAEWMFPMNSHANSNDVNWNDNEFAPIKVWKENNQMGC